MTYKFNIWRKKSPDKLLKIDSGVILCSDAIKFLSSIKSNIADIVFLDPPFNLGKIYGDSSQLDDSKDSSEYQKYMLDVLKNSIRILKPGGALYLYHIPQWAMVFSSYLSSKLNFRHWIAVSMKNGFVRGDYLYPAHYSLLYFTKGYPENFKRPKIPPSKCRHCGELVKDYGGYKKYIQNGVNLSDVWEDLSPVRHKKNKNRSENELPLELLRRVLIISGKNDGILVDPFVGAGTSLVAATESGMCFIASDKEESFCKLSESRIKEFQRKQKIIQLT